MSYKRHAKGVSTEIVDPLKKQPRTKIDLALALRLRIEEGLTYKAIGERFGATEQAARDAMQRFLHVCDSPEALKAYREQKLAVFEYAEQAILNRLIREVEAGKASVGDLARAMDVLTKNIRLMSGQSTANIGVLVQTLTGVHKDVDKALMSTPQPVVVEGE